MTAKMTRIASLLLLFLPCLSISNALEITELDWKDGFVEITNTSTAATTGTLLEITDGNTVQVLQASSFTWHPGEVRVYEISFNLFDEGQIWLHMDRTDALPSSSSIVSGLVWGANLAGTQPVESISQMPDSIWPIQSEFVDTPPLKHEESLQRIPGLSGTDAWELRESSWGAFGYQPDLTIGKTSSSLSGDGIYNSSGGNQRLRLYTWNGRTATFRVRLQNDGEFDETFLAKGRNSNSNFIVKWEWIGVGFITGQIAVGRHFHLTPGQSVTLKCTVTPRNSIIDKSREITAWLRASSLTSPVTKDYVYTLVKNSASKPNSQSTYSTANVYPGGITVSTTDFDLNPNPDNAGGSSSNPPTTEPPNPDPNSGSPGSIFVIPDYTPFHVLSSAYLKRVDQPVYTSPIAAVDDVDRDGILDSWESEHGLDPTDPEDAWRDYDYDRIINRIEFHQGTSPNADWVYREIEGDIPWSLLTQIWPGVSAPSGFRTLRGDGSIRSVTPGTSEFEVKRWSDAWSDDGNLGAIDNFDSVSQIAGNESGFLAAVVGTKSPDGLSLESCEIRIRDPEGITTSIGANLGWRDVMDLWVTESGFVAGTALIGNDPQLVPFRWRSGRLETFPANFIPIGITETGAFCDRDKGILMGDQWVLEPNTNIEAIAAFGEGWIVSKIAPSGQTFWINRRGERLAGTVFSATGANLHWGNTASFQSGNSAPPVLIESGISDPSHSPDSFALFLSGMNDFGDVIGWRQDPVASTVQGITGFSNDAFLWRHSDFQSSGELQNESRFWIINNSGHILATRTVYQPELDQSSNPTGDLYREYHWAILVPQNDEDGNGLPDDWELFFGVNDPHSDPDEDHVLTIHEYILGTDPRSKDTDQDGMDDQFERSIGSDPLNPHDGFLDNDFDGLSNAMEAFLGSDGLDSDTDQDGLPDRWEYVNAEYADILTADANANLDGNNLTNLEEFQLGIAVIGQNSNHVGSGINEVPSDLIVTLFPDLPEGRHHKITWNFDNGGETGFVIQRKFDSESHWSEIGRTGANVRIFFDLNVSASIAERINYRLQPVNAADSAVWSEIASIDVRIVPPVRPSEFAITNDGASVNLSWTDLAFDESAYVIERLDTLSSGQWAEVGNVEAGAMSFVDSNVDQARFNDPSSPPYYYRLRAYRDSDQSYSGYVYQATTNLQFSDKSDFNLNGLSDLYEAQLGKDPYHFDYQESELGFIAKDLNENDQVIGLNPTPDGYQVQMWDSGTVQDIGTPLTTALLPNQIFVGLSNDGLTVIHSIEFVSVWKDGQSLQSSSLNTKYALDGVTHSGIIYGRTDDNRVFIWKESGAQYLAPPTDVPFFDLMVDERGYATIRQKLMIHEANTSSPSWSALDFSGLSVNSISKPSLVGKHSSSYAGFVDNQKVFIKHPGGIALAGTHSNNSSVLMNSKMAIVGDFNPYPDVNTDLTNDSRIFYSAPRILDDSDYFHPPSEDDPIYYIPITEGEVYEYISLGIPLYEGNITGNLYYFDETTFAFDLEQYEYQYYEFFEPLMQILDVDETPAHTALFSLDENVASMGDRPLALNENNIWVAKKAGEAATLLGNRNFYINREQKFIHSLEIKQFIELNNRGSVLSSKISDLQETIFQILRVNVDQDENGLADAWEQYYGVTSPTGDFDLDGHTNLEEFTGGTDPTQPSLGEIALDGDSDGDGRSDLEEILLGSDRNSKDSDNDGLPDSWEWEFMPDLDPRAHDALGDPDVDGYTNLEEYQNGTDPTVSYHKKLHPTRDTDGDGMPNLYETIHGLNYNSPADAEGHADDDNMNNLDEYLLGTNPQSNDSDFDGMPDIWEFQFMPTLDPTVNDSLSDPDGDDYSNIEEFQFGFDPTLYNHKKYHPTLDTDNDGMPNLFETTHGFDYNDSSDGTQDYDRDGISNSDEYALGTAVKSVPLFAALDIADQAARGVSLSDLGEVTGIYRTADDFFHSFDWSVSNPNLTDSGNTYSGIPDPDPGIALGDFQFDGASVSEIPFTPLTEIVVVDSEESLGQFVGRARTPDGKTIAFLWWGDRVWNLNDLFPPGYNWRVADVVAINAGGQILASAYRSGKRGVILLNPLIDVDSDGMDDAWEANFGLNPHLAEDANSHQDNDQLTAWEEYQIRSQPDVDDSDGDDIPDHMESIYSLSPLDPDDASLDHDNDGYTNLAEIQENRSPHGDWSIQAIPVPANEGLKVIDSNRNDVVLGRLFDGDQWHSWVWNINADPSAEAATFSIEPKHLSNVPILVGASSRLAGHPGYWMSNIERPFPFPANVESEAIGVSNNGVLIGKYQDSGGTFRLIHFEPSAFQISEVFQSSLPLRESIASSTGSVIFLTDTGFSRVSFAGLLDQFSVTNGVTLQTPQTWTDSGLLLFDGIDQNSDSAVVFYHFESGQWENAVLQSNYAVTGHLRITDTNSAKCLVGHSQSEPFYLRTDRGAEFGVTKISSLLTESQRALWDILTADAISDLGVISGVAQHNGSIVPYLLVPDRDLDGDGTISTEEANYFGDFSNLGLNADGEPVSSSGGNGGTGGGGDPPGNNSLWTLQVISGDNQVRSSSSPQLPDEVKVQLRDENGANAPDSDIQIRPQGVGVLVRPSNNGTFQPAAAVTTDPSGQAGFEAKNNEPSN